MHRRIIAQKAKRRDGRKKNLVALVAVKYNMNRNKQRTGTKDKKRGRKKDLGGRGKL